MTGPPDLAGVEIAARSKKTYRGKIPPLMTEDDIGKYVIVDVYSGDCEIDEWRISRPQAARQGARRLRLHIGNRWRRLRYWRASAIRTFCVRFLIPGHRSAITVGKIYDAPWLGEGRIH